MGAIVIVVGHAFALYRARLAMTVSTTVALVVVGLIVVTHSGWLGRLYTLARRCFRSGGR